MGLSPTSTSYHYHTHTYIYIRRYIYKHTHTHRYINCISGTMIPYFNAVTEARTKRNKSQITKDRATDHGDLQHDPLMGQKELETHDPYREDDSSEEDSEFTASMEQVGLAIPNISVLKDIVNAIQEQTNQTRRDIGDIVSGLSFNNLQYLFTEIVDTAIHYPVEDLEGLQDLGSDTKATSDTTGNEVSSLQMTPKNDPKLNSLLEKYDYLTVLSFDEFNNEVVLRNKIKEILKLPNLSSVEYRFLIQRLMSHSYSEKMKRNREISRESMAGITEEEEGDDEDDDEEEYGGEEDEDGEEEEEEANERVILTAKDKTPTYYNIEENILGCKHYQRNCKIECRVCQKWYTCRFCHDEEIHDHHLPREETKHILCMLCQTPQELSQICYKCDQVLANYYCDICKLFDNDKDKSIYHCDSCGICRIGIGLNKDFFHCHNCNICISIDLLNSHQCIKDSTHTNCSICNEYMFNSTQKIIFMSPCSHPIHEKCFNKHIKYSYKCPICQKTIISMEKNFRIKDLEIKEHELPDPMCNWKSVIKCIDCNGKSFVNYHFMGLKCDHCNSYNTMQLSLIKPELEGSNNESNDTTNTTTTTANNNDNNSNDNSTNGTTNTNDQSDHNNHADINDANKNDITNDTDTSELFALTKNSLNTNFDKEEREVVRDPSNLMNHETLINEFTNRFLKQFSKKEVAKKEEEQQETAATVEEEYEEEDEEEDNEDYLIDNFINIVHNSDKYSNIAEAFKDWVARMN